MCLPWLSTVLCALFVGVVLGCSPEGEEGMPDSIVGKVYYSHAVVIGRATMIYPTPMLSPNAYTVEIQIDCVIKDLYNRIQGDKLNITEAGFIEGMCHSAEYQMGFSTISFMRADHSNLYKPWTTPSDNTPFNKNEAMKTCDLKPVGSNCPAASSDQCEADVNNYAEGQKADHDHDHDHHGDEDASFDHTHDDHHTDGEFDHDHDHDDHHEDGHDHDHEHDHSSEDDHHKHDGDHNHEHDEDVDFDHDHHDHHHDHDDYDHDHDHSSHHADKPAAARGSGHRDIMSAVAAIFTALVAASFYQ